MASSSDWLRALDRSDESSVASKPSWFESLPAASGFVEGAPFNLPQPANEEPVEQDEPQDEPMPEAAPENDPVAEAFARGQAEGRAEAKADYEARLSEQRALRLTFNTFDSAAMDSFAAELAETVIALCSQAIDAFTADSDALAARCAQAAKRLGGAGEACKLHLHPADLALLDPKMIEAWQVVADESVERSGLRFEGPDGSVSDSPADWRRAIAAAIKG